MPVQFQYVPTSGSLSGKSFETQTEQAFNELGSTIDESNLLAKKALETANTAKQLADSAVLEAEKATVIAQKARSEVQAAQDLASQAYDKSKEGIALAKKVQDIANKATELAINAQTTADEALSLSQELNTTLGETLEANKKIQAIAENAQKTANVALLKVNSINSYRINDLPAPDANKYYMDTDWLFITSDSKKNFPDIKSPCFFTVSLTDDGNSILQTAQEKDAPNNLFYRTGSLDTTNDNVTWGAWADSQELAKKAQLNTRVALAKGTTFYVRSDGNDKNDGSANTAQKAFKSIQGAIDYIYSHVISSRYDIAIQVGEGTFDSAKLDGRYSGFSHLYIKGAGKDKTIITNKNTNTYYAVYIGSQKRISFSDICFQVDNEKVTENDTIALTADLHSQIILKNTEIEIIETKVQNGVERNYSPYGVVASQHSEIVFNVANEFITTSTVASSRIKAIHNNVNSSILMYGTIKATGTVDIFIYSKDLSYSYANNQTIITGTVVGKRYQSTQGSLISVLGQGQNFFPGTIAGTTDSTAHYI